MPPSLGAVPGFQRPTVADVKATGSDATDVFGFNAGLGSPAAKLLCSPRATRQPADDLELNSFEGQCAERTTIEGRRIVAPKEKFAGAKVRCRPVGAWILVAGRANHSPDFMFVNSSRTVADYDDISARHVSGGGVGVLVAEQEVAVVIRGRHGVSTHVPTLKQDSDREPET
jgi:hypothetical protein